MSARSGAAAARRAHNPKVLGSNPSSATKEPNRKGSACGGPFRYLKRPSLGIAVVYNPGVEERRRFVPAPPIFFNLERSSVAMNKRKRVAITKHRAKKKKLKAKLAGAK